MIKGPTERDSATPEWAWLFLAGPILWYLYFWVVYLAAEAGCNLNAGAVVTWLTIGLTGATVVSIAYYAARASRSRESDDDNASGALVTVGLMLGVFFVVATLFVGAPALVLQPC